MSVTLVVVFGYRTLFSGELFPKPTVSVSARVALRPAPSETVIESGKLPASVGVPEKAPVEPNVTPAGRVPVALHV